MFEKYFFIAFKVGWGDVMLRNSTLRVQQKFEDESGWTQHFDMSYYHSKETKIIYLHKWESNPQPSSLQSDAISLRHGGLRES